MNIAIIPARGGSKRIPRKNIRPFLGRPIIAWSIDAALASGVFDEVMVSTDDEEIAELARSLGARVPFMRSPSTSDDHSTTAAVLEEVLAAYASSGERFKLACCIYPTAPFVTAETLRNGLQQLEAQQVDFLVPIVRFSFPVWRSLKRSAEGHVEPWFPQHRDTRSQDLPPAYHDAGQWYWFRTEALFREHTLYGVRTGSIELPETQVQDIDNEADWALAEMKHRIFHSPGPPKE